MGAIGFGIMWAVFTGIMWSGLGIGWSQIANRRIPFLMFAMVNGCIVVPFSFIAREITGSNAIIEATRTGDLVLVLGVGAVAGGLASCSMQRAMATGHHAMAWTIGQSAMIIPFLIGIIWWGDTASLYQKLGGVLIISGVCLFGLSKSKKSNSECTHSNGACFKWSLLTFLLFGISQTFCTIPAHWIDWKDVAGLRTPIYMTMSCIFFLIAYLVYRPGRPTKDSITIALICSVLGVAGQVGLFKSMDYLETVNKTAVVFPSAVGSCMAAFAIYSIAWLKEPVNTIYIIGLACAIAGVGIIAL